MCNEKCVVSYGNFFVEVYPSVKLLGDKIYLNIMYKGKYRDVYYQTLIDKAKTNSTVFKVQLMQASIVVMRIHMAELKGLMTDDVIKQIMPKSIESI